MFEQQVSEDVGFNTNSCNFSSDLCLTDTSLTANTGEQNPQSMGDVMIIKCGQITKDNEVPSTGHSHSKENTQTMKKCTVKYMQFKSYTFIYKLLYMSHFH